MGNSFKEAQLGSRSSDAWRSIMATKDIIEKSFRWNIGNGKRVHIWDDRWLPTPESFKVVSSQGLHTEVEMVSSLIDAERRDWNVAMVKNTFLPHEVEFILGIPISSRLSKDSLTWAWTPNGRFTMRSAYQVVQKFTKKSNQQMERGGSRMVREWKPFGTWSGTGTT